MRAPGRRARRDGARAALLDERTRRLDQRAVRHAGRTRGLAGAAAEAEIEMPDHLRRRLEPAVLERAHQVDAAARRVRLGAELDVRRAGGQAEPAVDAGRAASRVSTKRIAQIRRTKRPGAKVRVRIERLLHAPHERETRDPGRPHTSSAALTAGPARSTTSEPPVDLEPRDAAPARAPARASATRHGRRRTTPLGQRARRRAPPYAPSRSPPSSTRRRRSGSVAARSTAAAGASAKSASRERSAAPRRRRSTAPEASSARERDASDRAASATSSAMPRDARPRPRRRRLGPSGSAARSEHLEPERARRAVAHRERAARPPSSSAWHRRQTRLLALGPRPHLEGRLDDHAERAERAHVQLRRDRSRRRS